MGVRRGADPGGTELQRSEMCRGTAFNTESPKFLPSSLFRQQPPPCQPSSWAQNALEETKDEKRSEIFLPAQRNLSKPLLGDDSLPLMYLGESQIRRRGPQTSGKQHKSSGLVAPRGGRHRRGVFGQSRGWGRARGARGKFLLLSLASFPFLHPREGAWVPAGSPRILAKS